MDRPRHESEEGPQQIFDRYTRGEPFADIVLRILSLSDVTTVLQIVEMLPPEPVRFLRDFVQGLSERTRVFDGLSGPDSETLRFVQKWVNTRGKAILRRAPGGGQNQPIAVNGSPAFASLRDFCDSNLRLRGYHCLNKKGSVSWVNPER